MKFRFPLENVIRHRKSLEDIAQRNLQSALFQLEEENQALQALNTKKAEARNMGFVTQLKGGSVTTLSQVDEFLSGQDIRIVRQRAKVLEVEKEVENLREILRECARELKIVEKLKEKKRQEFMIEKRKKETKLTDELNVMRFRKNG